MASLDHVVRGISQAAILWKDGDPKGGFRCGYLLCAFAGLLSTERVKSMKALAAGETNRQRTQSTRDEWQRLVNEAAERSPRCTSYDELCRRAASRASVNPATGKQYHWETIKKNTRNPLRK